jgi:hypothetical protein
VIFAGKPARSEEVVLFAPPRNSVLPDDSPAAKEIVEAICSARRDRTFTPGMASNGSRRWRRGSISSPTRFRRRLTPPKARSASCRPLEPFYFLGGERGQPFRDTATAKTMSQTLHQRKEAMTFGADGGALRRPKILRFLQFP